MQKSNSERCLRKSIKDEKDRAANGCKFNPRRNDRRTSTRADPLRLRTIGRPFMRVLMLTVIASCVAWSSTAMAERYQVLPVNTHMGVARLDYTALLLDTAAGTAFNCSAQFDAKLSKFMSESACLPLSIDGKLPLGNVALPASSQTFGWIPLWAVDQQSGVVTFCTAHLTIQGLQQLWCTPVVTRKQG
jgi:hypothetical protein